MQIFHHLNITSNLGFLKFLVFGSKEADGVLLSLRLDSTNKRLCDFGVVHLVQPPGLGVGCLCSLVTVPEQGLASMLHKRHKELQ